MMLTIHGLPANITYPTLKTIIKTECKITEFILGVLMLDVNGCKKVRIGVADDKEGNIVMKCLDGFRASSGHVLRVIPIGKAANTFNNANYEWRAPNYDSCAIESVPNQSAQWPNAQGTPQWTGNQQTIAPQMPNQTNFGFAQQAPAIQTPFYQQHEMPPQNKMYGQQESFSQNRGAQPPSIGSKDRHNPYGNRGNTSNLINVAGVKDHFQGPSQYASAQPSQPHQGHYQEHGYNTQWSPHKTYTLSKHAPSQYDKQYDHDMVQADKGLQDQGKGPTEWGQYDKGRRSPLRDRGLPERRHSPPGHRVSPSGHRILPSGRRISPHRRNSPISANVPQPGRRISPPGRRVSQPARGNSPTGRKISPPGRSVPQVDRVIPPAGRRNSPSGRRISPRSRRSPNGRKISPEDRRILPANRRLSPSGHRNSPSGHRVQQAEHRSSPAGHGISPSGRRISPDHKGQRLSPRRMSPGKPYRDIASGGRASPNHGPSQREYARYPSPHRDMRPIPDTDIRPAYDPNFQGQNQPLYSGGYPQHTRENVQFSQTTPRPSDQRPVWQDREKPYITSNPDDRGIATRNQKFDPPRELDYQRGINQPEGKLHSPGRTSRSPSRRERSPIRDRYRRHSPSPRSPRRSWALEKRQSPENHETQLPHVWQHKESPYAMQNRPNDERITDPVWEKPYEEKDSPAVPRKEDRRSQDLKDRRYYSSAPVTRWGPKVALPIEHRDPPLPLLEPEDRFPVQREPKFSPREEFSRHAPEDCQPRQDRRDHRDFNQDHKNENYRHRGDERKPDICPDAIEIDDLYNRVSDLAKKTEEHRKKRNEKGNYLEEPESPREEEREANLYQNDVLKHNRDDLRAIRSNQNPYEASTPGRGSGHSRAFRTLDSSPNIHKRAKAIDELTDKAMQKYVPDIKGKNIDRVKERLKLIIESILTDMFDDKDVSFIEIVTKFEDRHHHKELERIVQRAMSDAPLDSRRSKRSAPDESHVPAKVSRDSPSPGLKKDQTLNANRFFGSNVGVTPVLLMPKVPLIAQLPTMVPIPYIMSQQMPDQVNSHVSEEGHYLFLCKNNFQSFTDAQISLLKKFIFNKMMSATRLGAKWTPDLTIKEVQNEMRLEVWTRDDPSKDWLINLDFNAFPYFSVLTYTAEELWYKRAAIWLPGHLKKQILAPLVKLKLQNRYLSGVDIYKWKLVKEIVTAKGTRLYVDLPPPCATGLESHDMLLSYELQKVHVFLKSVAVDRNAFDAGLEEKSIAVTSDHQKQNVSMPSINLQDPRIMKLCLSGKTIQLNTGHKIKEALLNNIFKYLREGGRNKMDFLNYGFTKPGYFCVVPENEETGKWVSSVNLGPINGQSVTVSGAYCEDTRYFTVSIALPYEKGLNPKRVLQNFKASNRGEKGLKFLMWKNGHVFPSYQGKRMNYRVNVDIASVETLIKLNFVLEYSIDNRTEMVELKPVDSVSVLEDIVNKWKSEVKDSLDVTNMDISTDEDDVVCID